MIRNLFDSGSLPVLERMVQFTSHRHALLADNIANLSTPYFKPLDLNLESFQQSLHRAIDQRRDGPNPQSSGLAMHDTPQLRFRPDGLDIRPEPTHEGVLFHDRNNRNLERLMQDLAENTLAFNVGINMIRHEMGVLETAIRERL